MIKELQTICLNGAWSMKDTCWPEAAYARVPGDIFSDLLAAGRMEDPYFRDQELSALPLSEKEYLYEKHFDLPAELLERECLLLRFEGIDTLADISLNGHPIASVNNMHRTWEFFLRKELQPGANVLQVLFHSPTAYIRQQYAKKRLDGTSDAMRGFPYLRKAHYMFGWDWGARLPGGGLFRGVSLLAFDHGRIDSVYIRQHHEPGRVTLTPQLELQLTKSQASNAAGSFSAL